MSGSEGVFYYKTGNMNPNDTTHIQWFLQINTEKKYVDKQIYISDSIQGGQKLDTNSFEITVEGQQPNYFRGENAIRDFENSFPGASISCNGNEITVVIPESWASLNFFSIHYQTMITEPNQKEFVNNTKAWFKEYGKPEVSGEDFNHIVQNINADAGILGTIKGELKIIKKLKESGVGIVYISHKMEEIKMISDEITILRDGKWISTNDASKITTEQIISMMVGRDLTERFPKKDNKAKEMILQVKNLTALNQPSIQDVSFELYKGEILGIAGLVGSKRTEIVETIFGMRPKEHGEIILKGKTVKNKSPEDAIKNGFALVTEERRSTGIFSMLDVAFNSVISNLDKYKNKFRLLKNKDIERDTKWIVDSMRVKTPSYSTKIGSLSGGNQQKVIIGRWLLTEPEVLMLDEPTRGIDVLAKYEIYQLMIDLAKKDKGIIMISSEMPELLGVTDRILVMSNGRVAGIVKTSETNQEEIMELSAKYL